MGFAHQRQSRQRARIAILRSLYPGPPDEPGTQAGLTLVKRYWDFDSDGGIDTP